jgi:hypothetical protein
MSKTKSGDEDVLAGSSAVSVLSGRGLEGGGWHHERQPPPSLIEPRVALARRAALA